MGEVNLRPRVRRFGRRDVKKKGRKKETKNGIFEDKRGRLYTP